MRHPAFGYLSRILPLLVLAAAHAAQAADDAAAAHDAAFTLWSKGDQAGAEQLLMESISKFPQDQRLIFFLGSCIRSRFQVAEAAPFFARTVQLGEDTVEGRSARHIGYLDAGREVERRFAALKSLAQEHLDHPLVLWMAAVQCRALNRNLEGVELYRQLMPQVEVGPVLLHQTFANLLDRIEKYDEALEHRQLAVKLEPAGWSYQGLGTTLHFMKRYEESSAAFAKATELSPENPTYWWQWGSHLIEAGKPAAALPKLQRAHELAPAKGDFIVDWGTALERLGHKQQALEKYEEAMKVDPSCASAYREGIRLAKIMGAKNKAEAFRKKRDGGS